MALSTVFDDPSDTHEEVMAATYRALCAHGYANLTIQRIADEFPKSKSLLYHHYDGKDDLLLEFLEFILEGFESSVPAEEYVDARAHLEALLDHVLPPEADLEEKRRDFASAIVELRAQATHDRAYHDHFTRSSRFFHDRVVAIVETGIEEGVFRPVDPERVATVLMTVFDGTRFRRSTTDVAGTIPDLRAELETYLEACVYAEREDAA